MGRVKLPFIRPETTARRYATASTLCIASSARVCRKGKDSGSRFSVGYTTVRIKRWRALSRPGKEERTARTATCALCRIAHRAPRSALLTACRRIAAPQIFERFGQRLLFYRVVDVAGIARETN